MAAHREEVERLRARVDLHLAERLDGVAVEDDAPLLRPLGEGVDVLHRADLVVHPHHRADCHVVAHERLDRPGGHPPGLVHGEEAFRAAFLGDLVQRAEHRLMLDRRRDGRAATFVAAGAPDADEGHVVGLGAARGEHDLVRRRAKTSGDALARLVERGARFAPPPMDAGGVAEARPEEGQHRGEDLLADRRGRGVIEIDWLRHTIEV